MPSTHTVMIQRLPDCLLVVGHCWLASKEHTPHFGDAAPATTCGQKPGLYANFLWVLGQWPPRHLKKWSEMLP